MRWFAAFAVLLLSGAPVSAQTLAGRHWFSMAMFPRGHDLSYAYRWSSGWSVAAAVGAQHDWEIVNVFVGREGCICNSHYRDFEVKVWSYSAGALVQREFPLSRRWSLHSGAGIRYRRGPQSLDGKRMIPLQTLSGGRDLSRISFDPEVVPHVLGGVGFHPSSHARVAVELERSFGHRDRLAADSRLSAAVRVGFALR